MDLGPNVFSGATVDTDILILEKAPYNHNTKACNIKTEEARENMTDYFNNNYVVLKELSSDSWFIANETEINLKKKIEEKGLPLGQWDVSINRGILTGFNDAFIINTETRNEILNNCESEAERERTKEIIKPILRGRDIKRYTYEWADLWLINTHNGLRKENISPINIKDYPFIKNHLNKYKNEITKRYDKGDTPYNLRNCKYLRDFEKEKIVWGQFQDDVEYAKAEPFVYLSSNEYFMICDNINYFLGVFNSRILKFLLNCNTNNLGGNAKIAQKNIFLQTPIPPITEENKNIVAEIENLVDKITEQKAKLEVMKKNNTLESEIENQEEFIEIIDNNINRKVYELYDLTQDEINIIEGEILSNR